MKSFIFTLVTVLSLSSLWAEDSSTKSDESKVILIEQRKGRIKEKASVFVETGHSKIAGESQDRVKPAYRSWDQKCQEWKKELRSLNGKNLLVMDCGKPTRTEESMQSEKWYTYSSDATYKIRVSE